MHIGMTCVLLVWSYHDGGSLTWWGVELTTLVRVFSDSVARFSSKPYVFVTSSELMAVLILCDVRSQRAIVN